MSESKVPLPESAGYTLFNPGDQWHEGYDTGLDAWDENDLRRYGDARAAEARRLALLEAAVSGDQLIKENDIKYDARYWLHRYIDRLRALADEASPKSVSG